MKMTLKIAAALLACSTLTETLTAQHNVMRINASVPATQQMAVRTKLGTSRSPSGQTIGVTTQFLTLDGKPWLPVMGELHFTRVPQSEWERTILRMKAAGVDIISSYVIWIHHEQIEDNFDWSGNKDIRHFAELCAKHGMYFYPRIGPWAHAEVRNGGLPDWVVAAGSTRENDPAYLDRVNKFYRQIGEQLKGMYWKDGGPIIGLQIENEYSATGKGRGADHIRTLKSMAIAAGMDVPLYTVTGWDNAAIPRDEVLPVFGGYPDAPWDSSDHPLVTPEIYAFRFANRTSGNMGAIGGGGQGSAAAYEGTPFLTAEIGGGIEDTYFRRPVVSPDDIAAVIPVLLGSGTNLVGYYMFVGGRNPDGGAITLQESQRTGYPTDVPVKSYDFQAPISNNGGERESMRRLKLVHYFLHDFGDRLAPMEVRRPSVTPSNANDLSVPRVSARTKGDTGFIFFNNHNRNAQVPDRESFQVEITLPSQTIHIPKQPITLPSNAYGIWPLNLDLQGVKLRYSTAQLMKKAERNGETYYFFFAIPGIAPEMEISLPRNAIRTRDFDVISSGQSTLLRARHDSGEAVLERGSNFVHLIVMTRNTAEDIWRLDSPDALLMTRSDVYSTSDTITLEQEADPKFEFGLFGSSASLAREQRLSDTFEHYTLSVKRIALSAETTSISKASPRAPLTYGPKFAWRKDSIPMAPEGNDFDAAARWSLKIRGTAAEPQIADVRLCIRYQGDIARLLQEDHLLDDDFWNGNRWVISSRNTAIDTNKPLEISILPLPGKFPMYFEKRNQLAAPVANGESVILDSVDAVPVYQTKIHYTPHIEQ